MTETTPTPAIVSEDAEAHAYRRNLVEPEPTDDAEAHVARVKTIEIEDDVEAHAAKVRI